MKIKDVRIQNFRSIEELTIPLDEVTVLIGANNSGKSAIVEALRIALSRRWGQQGTGFTENDIRVVGTTTDPRECGPIKITVTFEETPGADWPEDMLSVLEDIVTQTSSGRNQICISISYEWKEEEDSFIPSWEFLNSEGDALSKKRRAINLSGFFDYLLFYWLGALRDADSEFKSRGRHWGGLLKSMDLSKELEQEILQANNYCLFADQ
jgi:putative ATP-dependent endonuclease of OLD family